MNEIKKDYYLDSSRFIEERIRESERAAVDIGVLALKVVIMVNAGALIAILASADKLKGVPGTKFFLFGLILAGFAVLLSYIYQSLFTRSLWEQKHEMQEGVSQYECSDTWGKRIIWTVVILVSISFTLFIFGGFSALSHVSELYQMKL